MDFKTILVDLAADSARDARLDAALTLASLFTARVVGLTATGTLLDPYRSAGEEAARYQKMRDDMLQNLRQADASALDAAVARRGRGVDTSHVLIEQEAGWALAMLGTASDLILPPAPALTRDTPMLMATPAEYALLNAGRPILVMPPGTSLVPGGTVVIAWDGRREAARAVADAMPLLALASRVIMQVVLTGSSPGEHRAADVMRWLAQHGIEVSLRIDEAASPADSLLRVVRNEAADLLVTGGYGHSRLGELVMGGTTRTLLRNSPVPLLMSH
jgi:nucleotide-binding universal stress UspA family protein